MKNDSDKPVSRMEKCPTHDDRNPSLAVSPDGKAICLAGCDQKDVDAALAAAR